MHKYKELDIWNRAIDLTELIYKITQEFPGDERFNLISQIRRCSVSVPSNIAEGAGRNTKGEFRQFLGISLGSLFEMETQLVLANRLKYLNDHSYGEAQQQIDSLRRMIISLQKSLNKGNPGIRTQIPAN